MPMKGEEPFPNMVSVYDIKPSRVYFIFNTFRLHTDFGEAWKLELVVGLQKQDNPYFLRNVHHCDRVRDLAQDHMQK
jgi:hypothetical protein